MGDLFPHEDWSGPEALGSVDSRGLADRLRWAVEAAKNRGLEFPAQCRVLIALQTIENLARPDRDGAGTNLPSREEHVARHRTAMAFFWIMQAAEEADYIGHPFTPSKLSTVVRGADTEEGRDRVSRNIEFELTVAARLLLGGVRVFSGEPDLRFEYGREVAGVAVKRVTSGAPKQVKRALKSAVRQIERSGLRGYVAMSLERGLDSVPSCVPPNEVLNRADDTFTGFADLKPYFDSSPYVMGLMLTTAFVRTTNDVAPNGLAVIDASFPWRFLRFYTRSESEFGSRFWAEWQQRLAAQMKARLR